MRRALPLHVPEPLVNALARRANQAAAARSSCGRRSSFPVPSASGARPEEGRMVIRVGMAKKVICHREQIKNNLAEAGKSGHGAGSS